MNRTMIFLFSIIFILFTGCSETVSPKQINSKEPELDFSIKSVYNKNNAFFIYKIGRDEFIEYLESPNTEVMEKNTAVKYTYHDSDPWYITWNSNRFLVSQDLLNFVQGDTIFKKFLIEHHIEKNVVVNSIFEAPNVPITLWLTIGTENAYITINECFDDKSYTYRYYTYEGYYSKYGAMDACLVINGKTLYENNTAKLYYNYAEIPLTTVLSSLDADIVWNTKSTAIIAINGARYYLDVDIPTFHREGEDDNNLLYQSDGSPCIIYPTNNELMVDDSTFLLVLDSIGENVTINRDQEHQQLIITSK